MITDFLELIKISEFPTQTQVVKGESWFVITGPDGVGRKISEERLRYFLTTSTAGFVGAATPSTVPNTALGPQFYLATETGTYSNFGGLSVDSADGISILSYNGSGWSKSIVVLDLSNYALQSEFEVTQDVVNNLVSFKNLVKKTDIIGGNYITSGFYTYSDNWICTKKIKVKENQQYTVGPIQTASRNIVFFDVNGDDISYVQTNATPFTFTTPEGTDTVAITIQNTVGVGLDPLGHPGSYGPEFQMEEGSTQTTYEEWGSVKMDKVALLNETIGDINAGISDLGVNVADNQKKIEAILLDYSAYMVFNGTAHGTVAEKILSAEGDYFEAEMRLHSDFSGFADGLGLAGKPGATANSFGFYSSTSMYLRESGGGTYIQFTAIPDAFNFSVIRLQVGVGVWQLYINGVLHSEKPKVGNLNITSVGGGYNSTNFIKADIKRVEIKTGEVTKSIQFDTDFVSSVNIETGHEKDGEENAGYAPVYASFNPTGYLGRGSFRIYVRRIGKETYTGYEISNSYDMSDTVYIDYWRIRGANEYVFNGVNMAQVATNAIYAGESEFTMNVVGKADHTGGTHGDEITEAVTFFADGLPVSTDSAFDLLPCNEFSYVIRSTLHETAPSGGSPVPGHPVIGRHKKITRFYDGRYKTHNKVVFEADMQLAAIYTGIVCLGKLNATKGYTEDADIKTFTGSGSSQILRGNGIRDFYTFNETTEYSAFVTSRQLYPIEADPMDFELWIWDRSNDSKYYRSPDIMGIVNGDIWEAETEVIMK